MASVQVVRLVLCVIALLPSPCRHAMQVVRSVVRYLKGQGSDYVLDIATWRHYRKCVWGREELLGESKRSGRGLATASKCRGPVEHARRGAALPRSLDCMGVARPAAAPARGFCAPQFAHEQGQGPTSTAL